jgi:fructoselysine-6-P-deglycase FrlB-like protein
MVNELNVPTLFAQRVILSPVVAATQPTNITTDVTANGIKGAITTQDPALAAAAEVEFTVNNSSVDAGDVVVISIASGPSDDEHILAFVSSVSAGAFTIALTNLAATNQADGAMVINFAVIK